MFKKAVKEQLKLKLALAGPSGSGKTYSALKIAQGMGGSIAVLDTENGSASLYSDWCEFDVMNLTPPYTTKKYLDAIKDAEAAGYDILIIDSISHQWTGEGGILDRKAQLDERPGKQNGYTNWRKLTPEQEKFKSAILQSQIHMICTMRSKQEYAIVEGENGKNSIQKLGLAPIQRDGMEYEFTVMFDLGMDHRAEASKDRTSLFDQIRFQPSEETGKKLMGWLQSGKVVEPKPTREQIVEMFALAKKIKGMDLAKELQQGYKITSSQDLTLEQYHQIMKQIKELQRGSLAM